jgi:hypothetical protein
MAIIAYRPELESPAREGSLAVAFTREGEGASGQSHGPMSTLTLNPGVNRGVSDSDWEIVRNTPAIKALIKIRAIKEIASKGNVDPAEESMEPSPDVQEVRGLAAEDALTIIESSFDEKFLEELRAADPRKVVQGKIIARLAILREGKG